MNREQIAGFLNNQKLCCITLKANVCDKCMKQFNSIMNLWSTLSMLYIERDTLNDKIMRLRAVITDKIDGILGVEIEELSDDDANSILTRLSELQIMQAEIDAIIKE